MNGSAVDVPYPDQVLPPIPEQRRVWVPGRGRIPVREVPGPPWPEGGDRPTVLLIHGWIATGALNWLRAFEPLGRHFRVLAPDLRGHGAGIRSVKRFTLADCADDLAGLLRMVDTGPVIVVGYSMGGPIAQLLWRRHPNLVGGLVLGATGSEFVPGNRERYVFSAFMNAVAGTTRVGSVIGWLPGLVARRLITMPVGEGGPLALWARHEMSGHSVRMVLEAGHAIGSFSSKHWVEQIDVPTSVLVTERDTAVSPTAQLRLAMAIPEAHINRLDAGHSAPAYPEFGRKITDACLDVQRRIELLRTAGGAHTEASA